jgi:hypothetical protein
LYRRWYKEGIAFIKHIGGENMKIMNRRKGKKIAVMAAIIMGLMMFAFMPAASAIPSPVTSFTVTPGTGLAGAVDTYTALVTTDGVTSIDITIPAGFIAVPPATGGVEIARVNFWNDSCPTTLDYYGYCTISANNANPTTKVDVYCKLRVGGDAVEKWTLNQDVDYTAGATTTFVSGFDCDHSSATLTLPTEEDDGSINIAIDCADCPCFSENWRLDDVSIDIGQFVRNPTAAGNYDFFADVVKETVSITSPRGGGTVFRGGQWFVDKNGDHTTDIYFRYGILGDKPVVGDVNNNGIDDVVAVRNGEWWVSKENDHSTTDYSFNYGIPGDIPVIGDVNNNGIDDVISFRNGLWLVAKEDDHSTSDYAFSYGIPGDIPLVADINNNGIDDVIIFRNGIWFVAHEDERMAPYSPISTDYAFSYGIPGDKPIVADINMDGRNDVAILRGGRWYVSNPDHSGTAYSFNYGIPGDIPVAGEIGY